MKKESILSEASYTEYQQNPLTEVLSYCQVFFFPFYLKWCLSYFSFKLQEEMYYKFDHQ